MNRNSCNLWTYLLLSALVIEKKKSALFFPIIPQDF